MCRSPTKALSNSANDAANARYNGRMPNPDCACACGNPLYLILLGFFGDDVSGNRSKSWNKHWNTYMTICNLPCRLLQQEFHTHFLSTSPNASVTEQFQAFEETVEYTRFHAGSRAKLMIIIAGLPVKNQFKFVMQELDTGMKDIYTQYWINQLIGHV
jgi:hypothetical protein